jgi:diketogulonate reductase-like aldo/keto reductase
MRTVTAVALGREIPVIGQGTWGLGAAPERRTAEVDALREGVRLGMSLIDTAEFYAGGGAERIVGEAVRDIRDQVVLVDKLWPRYRRAAEVFEGVRGMLRRLHTDYLDAVLWHWPSSQPPLDDLLEAFEEMRRQGWIRSWGVSNFWDRWLDRLDTAHGGAAAGWNQLPYNLAQRGVELRVMPRSVARGMTVMAYSPLGHGRLPGGGRALQQVAAARGATPAQVALAWVTRLPGVVAIPKASSLSHVRDNAAADFTLSAAELAVLERAFPLPTSAKGRTLPTSPALLRLIWALAGRSRGGDGAEGRGS